MLKDGLVKRKKGDTAIISSVVYDVDSKAALDLTDAVVVVRARQTSRPPVTIPATVVGAPTDGRVHWSILPDMGTGPWKYQIRATRQGFQITGPTEDSMDLLIESTI